MPTARELLEQADALMRRNRAAAAGADSAEPAVKPSAAAAVPAMASPRTIQREPIAPSLARTSLPVDPSESPVITPGYQPPIGATSGPGRSEDVPLLVEAIADDADDVPLLTDAIEEIDVTELEGGDEPLVAETARGEASFWLDAPDADASLLGPAPDSVAVVPAPALAGGPSVPPLSPPQGRDPLGLDQPAPGFDAYDAQADAQAGALADSGDEPASWPETADPSPAALDPVSRDASTTALQQPPTVERAPSSAADDLSRDAKSPPAHDAPPPASESPGEEHASVALTTADDEARIRAIAEEIGMQVLQRIDIFTDTSLRERLGERLRPVVERVSADLVDALNQHVGELLRAYVAEAIEREIETWRSGQK